MNRQLRTGDLSKARETAGDAGSADLFILISRESVKQLCFQEAHLLAD